MTVEVFVEAYISHKEKDDYSFSNWKNLEMLFFKFKISDREKIINSVGKNGIITFPIRKIDWRGNNIYNNLFRVAKYSKNGFVHDLDYEWVSTHLLAEII